MKTINLLLFSLVFFGIGVIFANAQKAPAYKITNIKTVPFDSKTGSFEEELTENSSRAFFNELYVSLFVTVEVSGEKGSFEIGRILTVTVFEGKKLKTKKIEQVGVIGDGGKFYFPVFLEYAMCRNVKITAALTRQKPISTMTRNVPFMCGE